MIKKLRPAGRHADFGLICMILVGVLAVASFWEGMISAAGAEQSDRPSIVYTGSPQSLTRFGFIPEVPDAVTTAAQDGLHPFWEGIPGGDMERYGFPPGSDFENVSLGQPYRVMTISPETLFAYKAGDDIRSMLRATTMWFFPILHKGTPGAILTVDIMDDQWKAVAIGNAGLAAQLHELEQAWPENGGYEKVLVRIFQATSDIMIVINRGAVEVVPLESARISLDLFAPDRMAFDSWRADEIVYRLIPVVRANINQPVK